MKVYPARRNNQFDTLTSASEGQNELIGPNERHTCQLLQGSLSVSLGIKQLCHDFVRCPHRS